MFRWAHRAFLAVTLLISCSALLQGQDANGDAAALASAAPPSLSGIAGGGAVELGQPVTLQIGVNLPTGVTLADFTYEWRRNGTVISGATSNVYTIAAVAAVDAGTYTATVTNAGGSSVATATLSIKPLSAPVVTNQPRNATVFVSDSVTFTVTATGSYPRTYQWRKDGVDVPNANQSQFTIAVAALSDAGAYSVVITNSEGSATSTAAALTVNAPTAPVYSSNYPYDATAVQGNSFTFSAYLSGGSPPLGYQWFKNGAAIPGAIRADYTIPTVALSDAGKYYVVATNVAGSATSREATLTVTPAVIVSITQSPQSQTVYVGQSASLYVGTSGGSYPMTLQWYRNGTPIAGATYGTYSFNAITMADAGEYYVVFTNAAGTVTSGKATLTVLPAVAPTFTRQPAGQTVPYNGTLSLSAQVSGSPPITYQWKRDGAVISTSSTDYYVYNATPNYSGTYVLVATNAGGSVSSAPAVVTVSAPVVATITRQPDPTQAAMGLNASFSVQVNAAGAGSLTYQWLKNGVAIPGATSGTYTLTGVKDSDAGLYSVTITGPGGSVTSNAVKFTPLPPAPPSVYYWPSDSFTSIGSSSSFNFTLMSGSPPIAYQWFKDGVLLASSATTSLNFSPVVSTDPATYSVTLSNDGGLIASPPFRLRLNSTGVDTSPWVAAARLGDVVYFLAATPTARIERYDLAGERWLASTPLTDGMVPTAFVPTTEGVYLAYGRALMLRSPDLAREVPLVNTTVDITQLQAIDDFIYYNIQSTQNYTTTYALGAFRRSTQQAAATTPVQFQGAVYAAGSFRVIAAGMGNNTQTSSYTFGNNGALVAGPTAASDFAAGPRIYLSPQQDYVINSAGTVLGVSDLRYVGSLGDPVTDVAFLTGGNIVALRSRKLQALTPVNFLEVGTAPLAFDGARVFSYGSAVFVFGAPGTTGAFQVAKIAATAFAKPVPPAVTVSPDERYSVDDVFLGEDGVVHVFSRSKRALIRWSAPTRSYLQPIPLRNIPTVVGQNPGAKRALLAYADGQVTTVPLHAAASTEAQIATTGSRVLAVTDLDELTMLNATSSAYSGNGTSRVMIDANGRQVYRTTDYYAATPLVWDGRQRRLYSKSPNQTNAIIAETVPLADQVGNLGLTFVRSAAEVVPPIRFNPEGTLFATANGRVLDAQFQAVGALANNILDAAWLPASLYTIRTRSDGDTDLQQWSRATYLMTRNLAVRGAPVRIFRLSDTELVVVTSNRGYLSFTVLAADLTPATPMAQNVVVTEQPLSFNYGPGGKPTLSVAGLSNGGAIAYQWFKNGLALPDATASSVTLLGLVPESCGIYTAVLTNDAGSVTSAPSIIGIFHDQKFILPSAGSEVGTDIVHPNGNVYDQILLKQKSISVSANPGQVLRTSYIDLNNDIVQVEFAGAGNLTLNLENSSGPAAPLKYNQPGVLYMKGHANIVITGADETTNVSVFSVGRANAVNQALFTEGVDYDGVADIASIAIMSRNGKFGGVRTANVAYFNTRGVAGIYAPGVSFTGPVLVGDIDASDTAAPMLVLGNAPDVRITGGSAEQTNHRAVQVSGISQLRFVDGMTSQGVPLPAQPNAARYEQDGVDLTTQIVVNPTLP
jgi:hypothetical protein